jgi:hypothetical protein
MVIVMARSRAGFFPIRAAFPENAPGRHPHCSFRGLLRFHTHYGPPDCSPTIRGLCREVSASPVTRTHRSPAIESNHQLFEWVLPPLVISPFGAHAFSPALFCLETMVGKTGHAATAGFLSPGLTRLSPHVHLQRSAAWPCGPPKVMKTGQPLRSGGHDFQPSGPAEPFSAAC